jgi:hypothetical protein
MEWHMKRLRQRCCDVLSELGSTSSLTLHHPFDRSDRDAKFHWRDTLLLWRDNQWRRPPSKR